MECLCLLLIIPVLLFSIVLVGMVVTSVYFWIGLAVLAAVTVCGIALYEARPRVHRH